ncbi:MAG: sodium:solute symporter family protein [Rhizobiales bacterium]|nr:sodium:solute symporter family protein [Hyphomicrobiales bacterium]
MDDKVFWLIACVAAYWLCCVVLAFRGALSARSATDYLIAGRSVPFWIFVVAATATSFSGATFLGHPGLIYADGFQYAYTSFYAIVIPLTGVLFLKRQWMIGKRFGFVTPGEMFASYFRGDAVRLLVVLVAIMFSVPLIALQFQVSGQLVQYVSAGEIPADFAILALAAGVLVYVAIGGLRAVAAVATLQGLLLVAGMITLGYMTLEAIGGFDALKRGIALIGELDPVRTPDGHSHYLAVPGVIQLVTSGPAAEGGPWTAMMIFSYMIAMLGIQATPIFTMWAFASRDPAPFASQQVWASAFVIGIVLFVAAAIQGIGGHLLGADAIMNAAPEADGLVSNRLDPIAPGEQGLLVPSLITAFSVGMPWLAGLLALAAIAAMQSTGAVYLSTLSGLLTRDLVKHFVVPSASHGLQRGIARLMVLIVLVVATAAALLTSDALVLLGGIAIALGVQMWPALIAVCYVPWLTRTGITMGLIAGIVAVVLTEKLGGQIAAALGYALPWGRWPFTIHSALWGLAANLLVAVVFSALTQSREATEHRMRFHGFLRAHANLPTERRALIPAGWVLTVLWMFFAIGPGLVTGNAILGDPNDASTWVLGLPSIWAWQIIFWGGGVIVLWFLAYQLEMSTPPRRRVEALIDDIGDVSDTGEALRS